MKDLHKRISLRIVELKEYEWFRRCKNCQKGIFSYKTAFNKHEATCIKQIEFQKYDNEIECPKCLKKWNHLTKQYIQMHLDHCKIDFSKYSLQKLHKNKISKKTKKKNDYPSEP